MLNICATDTSAISIGAQLTIDTNRIYALLAANLLFFAFVFTKTRNEFFLVFNGKPIGFYLAKYTRRAAINIFCDTAN